MIFVSPGPDGLDSMNPLDSDDGELYGYVANTADVIAIYDNESDKDDTGQEKAAITRNAYDNGSAYTIGWDIGYQGTVNFSLAYATTGRFYGNGYSPGFDVPLRLIKEIFHKEGMNSVSAWPVPSKKDVSIVISHDIDAYQSSYNSKEYALLEQANGVPATYFWQTRYMNDHTDMRFFNNATVDALAEILEHSVGHEIGSHSVSHALTFAMFSEGSGNEQFPGYAPRSLYVDSKFAVPAGSILGELRVSQYLLEHFTAIPVQSFRPGHLAYPATLNEVALAAGYKYISTTTAPYAGTHLPHLMYYSRSVGSIVSGGKEQVLDQVEIPISWTDAVKTSILTPDEGNDPSRLGMAEPEFLAETQAFLKQLSEYGGNFTLLIHPTGVGHSGKIAYQENVFNFFKPGQNLAHLEPHYATMRGLGEWWLARHHANVDVSQSGRTATVTVKTVEAIEGLSLRVPAHWSLAEADPKFRLDNGFLVIRKIPASHSMNIVFTVR